MKRSKRSSGTEPTADRPPARRRDGMAVLAIAGMIGVGLAFAATRNTSPGSFTDTMAQAVASIDPSAGSRGSAGGPRVEPGKVVVAGLPAGFHVRVDGLSYPRSDDGSIEIPAKPGSHRVEIVNGEGEAWVTRVLVPEGGGSVRAEPRLSGEIVIESSGEPPAGQVWLDGRLMGALPLVIDDAAVGAHRVEIRAADSVAWSSDFTVRNGSVTRVEIPSENVSPE